MSASVSPKRLGVVLASALVSTSASPKRLGVVLASPFGFVPFALSMPSASAFVGNASVSPNRPEVVLALAFGLVPFALSTPSASAFVDNASGSPKRPEVVSVPYNLSASLPPIVKFIPSCSSPSSSSSQRD